MKWIAFVLLYIPATAGLTYVFAWCLARIFYASWSTDVLFWLTKSLGIHNMEGVQNFYITVVLFASLLLAIFAMRYVRRIAYLLCLLWKHRSR